jgi:lipid A 3-O-deacylase
MMPFRAPGLLAIFFTSSLAAAAWAQPPEDPGQTLTIQLENDSTRPGSDNYYTSGERIAYTSPTGAVWAPLADLGHTLLGDGQQRFSIDLSQLIFTPLADKLANPPPNDRPYAGVLLATGALIQDTDSTRTALSVGIGVIGPAALGEAVQNGFHELIGQNAVGGWHTQLPDQPVVQLTAERTWRVPLGNLAGGLEADVLPSVTLGAGTFRIYGQAGGTVRLGQGLQSDFGAPRIRPGLTGTDAYRADRPFVWYVFAGIDGQAVAWDETLDGLPFRATRHVAREPLVGEFQAGFALIAWGMRLTAMQVLQSDEFRTQKNGLFQFSSVSLSVKF